MIPEQELPPLIDKLYLFEAARASRKLTRPLTTNILTYEGSMVMFY